MVMVTIAVKIVNNAEENYNSTSLAKVGIKIEIKIKIKNKIVINAEENCSSTSLAR